MIDKILHKIYDFILSLDKSYGVKKFTQKKTFHIQEKLLINLIRKSKNTLFGKNHDFHKIKISKDIVDYIALQVDTNVRELEGVLISLLAHSTITKKEIDLELTKSVINKIVKNTKKKININYIQEIVSKFFSISIEQMKDKARKKEIVIARQVAMYFSKDFTNNSLKSIGFHFGGRDHSTVIHAVQSVNDMIDTDSIFKKNIKEINKRISM